MLGNPFISQTFVRMIKLGEHQKVVYTQIIYPMASDSQEMLIQMIHILNVNMGHFGNIHAMKTKTHESELFLCVFWIIQHKVCSHIQQPFLFVLTHRSRDREKTNFTLLYILYALGDFMLFIYAWR